MSVFVDTSGLLAMRQKKITKTFAFDRHFVEQGFETISDLTSPDKDQTED